MVAVCLICCILYQDIAINNETEKKRKREENLKNGKWSELIVVDDLPDQLEPANVANVPITTNATDLTIIEHVITLSI